MTTSPTTVDWHQQWIQQEINYDTELAQNINVVNFNIESPGGSRNAQGLMYTKKQIKKTEKGESTYFWWGYTTQVNFGMEIDEGVVVKQFMTLKGLDPKIKNTQLNFYCTYEAAYSVTKSGKTETIAAKSTTQRDCGDNEVATLFSADKGTFLEAVGNKGEYAKKVCPDATWYQSGNFVANNKKFDGWQYHWCSNYRSSADEKADQVLPIAVGGVIKYRAGYKVFTNAAGGTVGQKVMGSYNDYTIMDSGVLSFAAVMSSAAFVISLF